MECARSEHPGRFNNELYASALTAALRGDAFTRSSARSPPGTSQRWTSDTTPTPSWRASPTKSDAEEATSGGTSPSTADDHDRDEDASTGGRISPADLSRNLYDVLTKIPPVFEDYKRGAAERGNPPPRRRGRRRERRGRFRGDARSDEERRWRRWWCEWWRRRGRWCARGVVQIRGGWRGGGEESARASAKGKAAARRAVAAASAAAGAARASDGKTRDKWADGKRHRKLFADAWLALLRARSLRISTAKFCSDCTRGWFAHAEPAPAERFLHSLDRPRRTGRHARAQRHLRAHDPALAGVPAVLRPVVRALEPSAFAANNRKDFSTSSTSSSLAGVARLPRRGVHQAARRLASAHLPRERCRAWRSCTTSCGDTPGARFWYAARAKRRPGALFDEDPFVEDEDDPSECRALESSLWEMETLRSHYFPQVAKFTHVLDRDLSDRVKTAELPMGTCARRRTPA